MNMMRKAIMSKEDPRINMNHQSMVSEYKNYGNHYVNDMYLPGATMENEGKEIFEKKEQLLRSPGPLYSARDLSIRHFQLIQQKCHI